jgi:hypothetical protein
MKLTVLVVTLACLMGAMLALTVGPQPDPDGGQELVREEPVADQ